MNTGTHEDTPETRRRRARGRARLKALGIDVDTMTAEQIRQTYEAIRQAYIDTAEQGRHYEPVHIDGDPLTGACLAARHGMLTQALTDYFGAWPDDFPHHRVKWPTHHERAAGERGT